MQHVSAADFENNGFTDEILTINSSHEKGREAEQAEVCAPIYIDRLPPSHRRAVAPSHRRTVAPSHRRTVAHVGCEAGSCGGWLVFASELIL
jgi:hypothetical protein